MEGARASPRPAVTPEAVALPSRALILIALNPRFKAVEEMHAEQGVLHHSKNVAST